MIVFPSNIQLCLRAHRMVPFAALVEAGLIIRRDSPNGKRYARRDRSGDIETRFRFRPVPPCSLVPRSWRFFPKKLPRNVKRSREQETLTISRRDCRKLISAALEEGASGDWAGIEDAYLSLVSKIPRSPILADLLDLRDELDLLREEVVNRLKVRMNAENCSSNDALGEQHTQNSKPESTIEFEPTSEKEQGAKTVPDKLRQTCSHRSHC